MYAVQEVPGRGNGLVATQRIPRGTRIPSEEPAVTIPYGSATSKKVRKSIRQQVDALNESQREIFLSMHNIYPYKDAIEQYIGITRTVSLPVEEGDMSAAIFLEACRINHACDNNANKEWNSNIKRHTVHALRDIEQGEEITVYYIAIHNSRKERQEKLRAKFDFTCSCRLCSLPPEESKKSDDRLEEIDRLDKLIEQGGGPGILKRPVDTLGYVERMVKLYNEEGPGDVGLARCYFDAAQIVITHGDLARGRIFADKAVSAWRIAFGDDYRQVIEQGRLVENPASYLLYGASMRWKKAVDDVPSGLDAADFEDWLWKRDNTKKPKQAAPARQPALPGKSTEPGKSTRAAQLADLRDRTVFTSFKDLPNYKTMNQYFFEESDAGGSHPRRHWCLLAEIQDFQTIHHLEMALKDGDGNTAPFHFYTAGRGSELAHGEAREGYTAAVLYPKPYRFVYGDPGIRHEDARLLKIFPASLQSLLEMNDQIQMFSKESEGVRKCHGCEKEATSLVRCAQCSFFWYCNKECQTNGWKEKRHKDQCKLLKNPDLRSLFTFKWGEFSGKVRFPLHESH